jgi:hypothetical protein
LLVPEEWLLQPLFHVTLHDVGEELHIRPRILLQPFGVKAHLHRSEPKVQLPPFAHDVGHRSILAQAAFFSFKYMVVASSNDCNQSTARKEG